MNTIVLVKTCKECSGVHFDKLPEREIYECFRCGYPNTESDMRTQWIAADELRDLLPRVTGAMS